jgi:hypothetical protein
VLAQITTGPVNTDDDEGALYNDGGDPAGVYTDYKIVNRYEKDRHLYMLPISSPGGFGGGNLAAFVQLAAPTLLWISDWTACRFNSKPEIPDPTLTDSNWVLLDEHYEPFMLTVAANGSTPLYRISGTFVYGNRNPSTATIDDINFPRPPWLKDPSEGRIVTPSDEEDDLIDEE